MLLEIVRSSLDRARVLLAIVLCVLAACHDEDYGGPSFPPSEVQGLWLGTLSHPLRGTQSPARLIVDPNGHAYLIPLSDALQPLPPEFQGDLQSEAGVVSGRLWRSPSTSQSVDVSGEVMPRWSMLLDLDGIGLLDGSRLDLGFDPAFDRGSSLASVAGIWHLGDLMLSIDSSGAVTGSDLSGSTYQGFIYAPWPQANIYTIDLDAYWSGAAFPCVFDGVATLIDGVGPSEMLLISMSGSSSLFSPIVYWSPQLSR